MMKAARWGRENFTAGSHAAATSLQTDLGMLNVAGTRFYRSVE